MTEGVRGSSQGLRESEAPVRFLGSQRVQIEMRESGGPVRV